jgi:hypothetical protein
MNDIIAQMQCCGDASIIEFGNRELKKTRISCPLSVERGNESRHLVFRLLGTLTGLRDRTWRLVA